MSNAPRLLVIDDDLLLRGMAARALRHGGFHVTEADSGERGLAHLAEAAFDLILLDVVMPGLDGFETCRRVRATPMGERLPVLMMTGLNDVESIEKAYDAGATDFITKPVQWGLLVHRVRYGLRVANAVHELQRGRESLARAQHLANMGSWQFTAKGGMTGSDEIARIYGSTPQVMATITLTGLLERVRESDRERVRVARDAAERGVAYQITYMLERFDGHSRTVFEQAQCARDTAGRIVSVDGITQDITERVEAERQVRHLALHDALTGLPNREFFIALAGPALEKARRNGAMCAVLHVDIDRFKRVNDALGHGGGDQVLVLLAARLQAVTRGADISASGRPGGHAEVVARMGGNAFTIMLLDVGDPKHAGLAAQRLRDAMAEPVEAQGRLLQLSASVGIALFPRDANNAAQLAHFAEQALDAAKKAGQSCHRFFDETMNAVASARLEREDDLRRAIAQGELRMYLQAKIDVLTGAFVAAEALVRWQHPKRGLVPPFEFIPLAEETGLILPLTDWMFEQAASQQARWARAGRPVLPISVNVAASSFMADGLVEDLLALVARHGVVPAALTIEVTESMLMHDVDRAIARLVQLREQGFRLSLDDFGTGYSSLSYIKRFPLDELKIDRSFVIDVHRGGKDGALVASIITLARMLDIQVVAEGVETQEQADALRLLGCHLHQGYLYARPVPALEFDVLLDAAPRLSPLKSG